MQLIVMIVLAWKLIPLTLQLAHLLLHFPHIHGDLTSDLFKLWCYSVVEEGPGRLLQPHNQELVLFILALDNRSQLFVHMC